MKLYNKTKYPDELLESLLVEAGKAVKARTSNVIVIATSAKQGYNRCSGVAQRADWVMRWALSSRAYKKGTGKYRSGELKEGMVETDGGYYKITLPYPFIPEWVRNSEHYKAWKEANCYDGISIAENIFKTASHEWQHIKQYQINKYHFRDRVERAKHHDNRVWEKDAIKASSKAINKPHNKAQEAILNISLWLESNNS